MCMFRLQWAHRLFLLTGCLIISIQSCDTQTSIASKFTENELAIDEVVKKYYHSWYVKSTTKPDFSNFSKYVTDSATFHSKKKDKVTVLHFLDVVEGFKNSFKSGDITSFDKREVGAETIIIGDIAHRISYHIYRINTNGRINQRGVNSIQLVKVNGIWKIQSILRQLESDYYSLPKKYDSFKELNIF